MLSMKNSTPTHIHENLVVALNDRASWEREIVDGTMEQS